jgi:hypothetical protein
MQLKVDAGLRQAGTTSHEFFEQFEQRGVHTMKYFIEPVVLAINYAQTLGYERFVRPTARHFPCPSRTV